MKLVILIICAFLLTGFNNFLNKRPDSKINYFVNKRSIEQSLHDWNDLIKFSACKYNVDEKLIKSIIYAESSGNTYAKSSSNAIGLMQIKPSSAGAEVYRLTGKYGQPTVKELYNPKININIGTAYINFLQKQLIDIKNKDVMRYATIVSYVNGKSGLLKIFSKNHKEAINIINTMTAESFSAYVKKNIQQNKLFVI